MQTETYKGIEIEIHHDTYAENPWENWDGCVPLISVYDNYRKDYSNGEIDDFLRNYLSYNQIKRHQKRILDLMEYDVEEFREDYPLDEYDRTEMIKDDLLYSWLGESIRNKASFCEEFDIKHYHSTNTGYSQSDWADLFLCWTPEFEKVTGRSYESMTEDDFKGSFNLWGHWAWGDVYYFMIEADNFDDSCGGFYGDDHEESGLLEMARESIDHHLKEKKKQKEQRVKTLIKNKVPLQYRAQEIAG